MSVQWPDSELAAPEDEAADESPPAESDDDVANFQAELARTMHRAAALERMKIAEEAGRRREVHIERVRARQADEADRMRELAGEDMKAIDAWAAGELKRIRAAKERRVKDLNDDLALSLAQHGVQIDQEIEGIETAISTYLADVDDFFDDLDRETDVVRIATQAANRPTFPNLDSIRVADPEASSGDDALDPEVVAVMDPDAEAEPIESWAAPEVEAPAESGENVDAMEPVSAIAGSSQSSSLFQSVSVVRPMSWLRRDSTGGDRDGGPG